MKGKRLVIMVGVTLVVALLCAAGGASAGPSSEGPAGQAGLSIAGAVASKISYQGRLTDAQGNPQTGSHNLKFEFWDQATGGSKLGERTVSGVQVENGLFTAAVDVDASWFQGQGLWLAISVDGQLLSPRQEVLPVPYALSMKPGASIKSSIYNGSVLWVENTDPDPAGGGYAIFGKNASGNTWRPAIYGENTGASAGVYGRSDGWHATVGWQNGSNPANAGVYGYNGGAGPGVKGDGTIGGFFTSANDHYDITLGGAVGRINTDPANAHSDLILSSNRDVIARLDNDSGEDAVFRIKNSGGTDVFTVNEGGKYTAASGEVKSSIYNDSVLRVENTDPNPAGGGWALFAKNASGNTWRPAIYGENTGASAGVYGRSDGWHATVGWQNGSNPANAGVYGYNGGAGPGVKGDGTMGGFFTSANDHYDIMLGGAVGRINTDPGNAHSDLILSANRDVIVRLDNDGGENAVFRIKNSGGTDVLTVDESGNFRATGNKSALVETATEGQRLLYALESSEVWFEDLGTASLQDGEAAVAFEPVFAQTVNPSVDYHVFLTPISQEPVLLFVTAKTADGFAVRGVTLDGQPAECDFEYRIVAKRLGYEQVRLGTVRPLTRGSP